MDSLLVLEETANESNMGNIDYLYTDIVKCIRQRSKYI